MRSSSILVPCIKFGYRLIAKPLLFKCDPERVHDSALKIGHWLGSKEYRRAFVRACFNFSHSSLQQNLIGLNFTSAIGLAAGFDKNAKLIEVLPELGFGFAEVGSVTGRPCAGNPKPRLWRLPKSKSLAIFYGLANDGAALIAQRVAHISKKIPLGVNIAKTNDVYTNETEAGIEDYLKAYREVKGIADYITINISCPNVGGGEPFKDPENLEKLLLTIDQENSNTPIFVKLSADLNESELDQILAVIKNHKISGLICSNLTHSRDAIEESELNLKTRGGLSGKAVATLSNELLTSVYKKTKGRYILIGCGGIFSALDAYEKIKRGANLLQLISGMIYNGPQFINELNRGLVKLLKKDGYTNISQAVGSYYKK